MARRIARTMWRRYRGLIPYEDLVQDGLLGLHAARLKGDVGAPPVVLQSAMRQELRAALALKRQPGVPSFQVDESRDAAAATHEESIEPARVRRAMESALDDRLRHIVTQHALGRASTDLARELRCSNSTISRLLAEALCLLRCWWLRHESMPEGNPCAA